MRPYSAGVSDQAISNLVSKTRNARQPDRKLAAELSAMERALRERDRDNV